MVVLFGGGVEGFNALECKRVGEQQKLKEFDLSNPLVQAKLKERYGKNIPLEETVVSPQAVSMRHNSPLSPKNGRCFRGDHDQNSGTKKAPCGAFFGNPVLFAARDVETLVEAVNTATGSNITLFASEERVALAAHVEVQVTTNGGADFHYVTARAASSNFFVFRVPWENLGLRPRRFSSPNARHHAMLKV